MYEVRKEHKSTLTDRKCHISKHTPKTFFRMLVKRQHDCKLSAKTRNTRLHVQQQKQFD